MRIDLHTVETDPNAGYGRVTRLLSEALERQGVEITPGASVVFNYCMPKDYKWKKGAYHIGYTPWESTKVPDSWWPGLRAVDELWTTSEWCKEILTIEAERSDVRILEHGIDPLYQPRSFGPVRTPFTFLFIGDPAVRKGSEYVLEAWYRAFGNDKNVKLVYKCRGFPRARIKDKGGSVIASPGMFDNIQVITQDYTTEQLVELHASCHALVYPSRGEGWGLIPWEACGMGMPAIFPWETGMREVGTIGGIEQLRLREVGWEVSADQVVHPGDWMTLSVDEIINHMHLVIEKYPRMADMAHSKAESMHESHSWDRIAERMVAMLDESVPEKVR